MKAISLWQPWASLIACRAKVFETRSWAPPLQLIGGPIAIHAAKKVDKGAAQFATDLIYGQHDTGGFALADALTATWRDAPDCAFARFGECIMPVGCVVCIAKLEGAWQLGEPIVNHYGKPAARVVRSLYTNPPMASNSEAGFSIAIDDFGDYAPGRWAWMLGSVRPLIPPPPAKGHQGFFDLPQGWLTS